MNYLAHLHLGGQRPGQMLGSLYGVLAQWRKSLRPGMLAHAWADTYGGLQLDFLSRIF